MHILSFAPVRSVHFAGNFLKRTLSRETPPPATAPHKTQ